MREKKRKTIVIGSEKYSAQGYFYMAIKDAHLVDEIVVKSSKYRWDIAEVVVAYLKLNGWKESNVSNYEEKTTKSRCTHCNKVFQGQQAKCLDCGNICKEFSYIDKVIVLEKIGALQAHQDILLSEKKLKNIFLYIEQNKQKQELKDNIILSRWG